MPETTCRPLPEGILNNILTDYQNIPNEPGVDPVTPDKNPSLVIEAKPDASPWGNDSTISMGIPLNMDNFFDPQNPDHYSEPDNKPQSAFDTGTHCAYKVTVGTNLVIDYHVRRALSQFVLREANPINPETDFFTNGYQTRRKGSGHGIRPKHF